MAFDRVIKVDTSTKEMAGEIYFGKSMSGGELVF